MGTHRGIRDAIAFRLRRFENIACSLLAVTCSKSWESLLNIFPGEAHRLRLGLPDEPVEVHRPVPRPLLFDRELCCSLVQWVLSQTREIVSDCRIIFGHRLPARAEGFSLHKDRIGNECFSPQQNTSAFQKAQHLASLQNQGYPVSSEARPELHS